MFDYLLDKHLVQKPSMHSLDSHFHIEYNLNKNFQISIHKNPINSPQILNPNATRYNTAIIPCTIRSRFFDTRPPVVR
jgi:hypothetical protein